MTASTPPPSTSVTTLPRRLRIGISTVAIRLQPGPCSPRGPLARWLPEERALEIPVARAAAVSGRTFVKALLAVIGLAIADVSGLTTSDTKRLAAKARRSGDSGKDPEFIQHRLAHGFAQAFIDNPWLHDWLELSSAADQESSEVVHRADKSSFTTADALFSPPEIERERATYFAEAQLTEADHAKLDAQLTVIQERFMLADDGLIILRRRTGRPARFFDNGRGYLYAAEWIDKASRNFRRSRIVFGLTRGWLPKLIDHRDRNRQNDHPRNLRPSPSQRHNSWNAPTIGPQRKNGLPRNVYETSPGSGEFVVRFWRTGQPDVRLGPFATPEIARLAREQWQRENRGEWHAPRYRKR